MLGRGSCWIRPARRPDAAMTATCSSTTSPSVADTPNSGRRSTTPIHVVDVGSLTRTDVDKAPVALRCLAHGDEMLDWQAPAGVWRPPHPTHDRAAQARPGSLRASPSLHGTCRRGLGLVVLRVGLLRAAEFGSSGDPVE